MITLILATDMARHAEIMDSFKEKMENFDYSNEEHLTLVGCVFRKLNSGEKPQEPSVLPSHGVLEGLDYSITTLPRPAVGKATSWRVFCDSSTASFLKEMT
jgi:hypothetical protein